MNNLYYKYTNKGKDGVESFEYYRVTLHGSKTFRPKKGEVVVIMCNESLDGDILIGDGRRTSFNLPHINEMFVQNSFVIKPGKLNEKDLKQFIKKMEKFLSDQHSDEEFWATMDLIKENYTDLNVNDREEKIDHIANMIRKIIYKAIQVLDAIKDGEYLDCISPEDLVDDPNSDLLHIKWSDKSRIYLPKFKEMILCDDETANTCLYVGDGQHVLCELESLEDIYFYNPLSTIQNEYCMKFKFLFDSGFKHIMKDFAKYSVDKISYRYLNELKKYTDVDIDDLSFGDLRILIGLIGDAVNWSVSVTEDTAIIMKMEDLKNEIV